MKANLPSLRSLIVAAVVLFNIASGQSAFSVKGAASDSLLAVKDNGKVGIGTANPVEHLDIKGALRLATNAQARNGTVRYTNGKFEGYSSGIWYMLNNEIYTLSRQSSTTSTVRNAELISARHSLRFPIPDGIT